MSQENNTDINGNNNTNSQTQFKGFINFFFNRQDTDHEVLSTKQSEEIIRLKSEIKVLNTERELLISNLEATLQFFKKNISIIICVTASVYTLGNYYLFPSNLSVKKNIIIANENNVSKNGNITIESINKIIEINRYEKLYELKSKNYADIKDVAAKKEIAVIDPSCITLVCQAVNKWADAELYVVEQFRLLSKDDKIVILPENLISHATNINPDEIAYHGANFIVNVNGKDMIFAYDCIYSITHDKFIRFEYRPYDIIQRN